MGIWEFIMLSFNVNLKMSTIESKEHTCTYANSNTQAHIHTHSDSSAWLPKVPAMGLWSKKTETF